MQMDKCMFFLATISFSNFNYLKKKSIFLIQKRCFYDNIMQLFILPVQNDIRLTYKEEIPLGSSTILFLMKHSRKLKTEQ